MDVGFGGAQQSGLLGAEQSGQVQSRVDRCRVECFSHCAYLGDSSSGVQGPPQHRCGPWVGADSQIQNAGSVDLLRKIRIAAGRSVIKGATWNQTHRS